jgi:hypothetical protein
MNRRALAATTCDLMAIIFATAAAILWFWSATVELPLAPGAVLDGTTPDHPFNIALHHAAYLNALAAFLTGVSVGLMAIERGIRIWGSP